jgi:hypothetical protein
MADKPSVAPKGAMLVLSIAMPVVAVALIVARSVWPEAVKVDAVTLGLVALGCLPWLPALLESAKLPGGWEFKLAHLEQKVDQQQEQLNSLVKYAMSETVYKHLWYITETTNYLYVHGSAFSREM